MKFNSFSWLSGLNTSPVWAPADEGGAGGGGGEGTETGDDTSGEATPTGEATETALGGGEADDKSSESTALGGEAEDKGDEGEDTRTDEEKAADEKAAEVPEDGVYDFEMPEGVELTDDKKELWSGTFKELGLTRAQASALVALQGQEQLAQAKEFSDFLVKQQDEHLAAAKADKDIGGDKWDQSVAQANRGLQALRGGPKGDPKALGEDGKPAGFKEPGALENLVLSSGNGNNPEIIRELGRIGALFKDDKFENGASVESPKSTESAWYGATTPDKKKG